MRGEVSYASWSFFLGFFVLLSGVILPLAYMVVRSRGRLGRGSRND